MRDADPTDAPGIALFLQRRQVLAPGDEVVQLLDLDAAEPAQLPCELRTPSATGSSQIFVATIPSSRRPSMSPGE